MTRAMKGCADQTAPRASKWAVLGYALTFARTSGVWGGGGVGFVDFLRPCPVTSVVRMHLVTFDQYNDVVQQENVDDPGMRLPRDALPRLRDAGHGAYVVLDARRWYGCVVYLGDFEGHPVLTFTCAPASLYSDLRPPSLAYFGCIASGLESAGMRPAKAREYLTRHVETQAARAETVAGGGRRPRLPHSLLTSRPGALPVGLYVALLPSGDVRPLCRVDSAGHVQSPRAPEDAGTGVRASPSPVAVVVATRLTVSLVPGKAPSHEATHALLVCTAASPADRVQSPRRHLPSVGLCLLAPRELPAGGADAQGESTAGAGAGADADTDAGAWAAARSAVERAAHVQGGGRAGGGESDGTAPEGRISAVADVSFRALLAGAGDGPWARSREATPDVCVWRESPVVVAVGGRGTGRVLALAARAMEDACRVRNYSFKAGDAGGGRLQICVGKTWRRLPPQPSACLSCNQSAVIGRSRDGADVLASRCHVRTVRGVDDADGPRSDVWLDAQGRSMIVATPSRHIVHPSDAALAEWEALGEGIWEAARIATTGREAPRRGKSVAGTGLLSLTLNAGDYANVEHIHAKIRIAPEVVEAVWKDDELVRMLQRMKVTDVARPREF